MHVLHRPVEVTTQSEGRLMAESRNNEAITAYDPK